MYNSSMKWLIVIAIALFIFKWVSNIKKNINLFLENYDILIVDKDNVEKDDIQKNTIVNKDILSMRPLNYDNSIDLRGTPTHVCPCGSMIWDVKVVFEDYEIATYFLDMECINCGSVATAPTPLDRTEME